MPHAPLILLLLLLLLVAPARAQSPAAGPQRFRGGNFGDDCTTIPDEESTRMVLACARDLRCVKFVRETNSVEPCPALRLQGCYCATQQDNGVPTTCDTSADCPTGERCTTGDNIDPTVSECVGCLYADIFPAIVPTDGAETCVLLEAGGGADNDEPDAGPATPPSATTDAVAPSPPPEDDEVEVPPVDVPIPPVEPSPELPAFTDDPMLDTMPDVLPTSTPSPSVSMMPVLPPESGMSLPPPPMSSMPVLPEDGSMPMLPAAPSATSTPAPSASTSPSASPSALVITTKSTAVPVTEPVTTPATAAAATLPPLPDAGLRLPGVPGVCIGAHHLVDHKASELVFRTHRPACVLCDAQHSCATAGHIVEFRGRAMAMRTYCAVHATDGCVARVQRVNSPRWRGGGVRVGSATTGLRFTALAARWETAVEERVLSALARLGA